MNKGDNPPRSLQEEEAYLQEEANMQEVEEEEEPETGEIEIEWDGSEAELVADEDAEEFEDNFAGIKLNYVLKEEEIYDALRSSKSYKSAQKRMIVESIISCVMSGVFFTMFAIDINWTTLVFAILFLILAAVIWPASLYSVRKNAKRLTSGEEVQMEIYPSLIEMGKEEDKWIIPLDGTVKCRKTNHLFVLQTDPSHITILPVRCIEPSVLPDVEAIILSGTAQTAYKEGKALTEQDRIPALSFDRLSAGRDSFSNAYLIARSTVAPIHLPIIKAGICLSLAILSASVLPLYITFFSGFVMPVIAVSFFVLLSLFFAIVWPGIIKGRGAKIFDSNQMLSLPFSASFFKSFFEIENEKETIREYWTEIDRSLETKNMFIILGGRQRPLVLIEKKHLSDEQQNTLSSFLEKVLIFKHKKAK